MKLYSIAFVALVIGSSVILSYTVRSPLVSVIASKHNQTPATLLQLLEELKTEIQALPEEAFSHPKAVEQRRKAICNDIKAVVHQVEAGAYTGSIRKLENAFRNKLAGWILDPWKTDLIDKVNHIIDAFGHYV